VNYTVPMRVWDENHLMRMAGRFSRRLRAWAKAKNVPGVSCAAGERKDEIAEEHLSNKQVKPGLFLILLCDFPSPNSVTIRLGCLPASTGSRGPWPRQSGF